jgi:hypothetical protein
MNARLIAPAVLALAVAACDGPIPPFCGGDMIDACSKARDLAAVMSTQLADEAVAEGNAIVGESGALHNEGRVEMSFRANAMSRNSPTFDNVTVRSDATVGASSFGVDAGAAASLAGEVALRVSRGARVGDTRTAGLDLLGGLRLTPHMDGGSIHTNGGTLGYSYGARLGILQETDKLPAVSLTGMVRVLPKFSLTTERLPIEGGQTVSLSLSNGKVETTGVRLAASKRFGRFGLSGGVGRESYYTTVEFNAESAGTESTDFTANRNTAFIGGSLGIGATILGMEVGSVFGGKAPSITNSFGDASLTDARTFVSLGVRLPMGRVPAKK